MQSGQSSKIHSDVWAGVLFAAFGLIGLWLSRNYTMGTLQSMSTGYFPQLVCYGLILLGGAITVIGYRKGASEEGETVPLSRAVILIPLAVAIFGWTIEEYGLVVALVVMLSIGALAGRGLKPLSFAVAVVTLIVICYLIFIWGLNMPIDVWPRF